MNKRILITGASVAGPTLAWWLQYYGYEVTVLEKQPKFRDGGQNIDVRGVATTVLERMGLLQAVKDRNTGEQGFSFVDAENVVIAEFDKEELGSNGLTAELEILRGQLAGILYDHTCEHVEYRFGDSIKHIEELETGVQVSFEKGEQELFDLVIVAEGANSSTRQLLFSSEVSRKPYDLYLAYFTIPHSSTDSQIARWYNAVGGRSLCLRPDNTGTARALLGWQHPSDGLENLPHDQQKKRLHEIFADAGWEATRLLAGLDEATTSTWKG
jgi:2-polyprenyl-6-methoxyphenol hydroxylase-like FAD-dependent oxidoreductase